MAQEKIALAKLRIFVLEGNNISNGLWGLVDTPDTRIEIKVPLSIEKRQVTKTVEAKKRPIWNESLMFHVELEKLHLAECEIFLQEDNFPLPDVQKGYLKCLLTDLKDTLTFGEASVNIKVQQSVVHVDATQPGKAIYQLYKTNIRPVKVLNINIIEGRNITNGWWDFFDTPDTFVEVLVSYSPEKKRRTKTVTAKGNPKWDESLVFHFDPRFEADIEVEFRLMEDNQPVNNIRVGYKKFHLADVPQIITFEEGKTLDVSLHIETAEPDLKERISISEDEASFCDARRKHVHSALRSLLGNQSPNNINDVPNIAILGSGGGFRAMIGLCGAMNALENSGILDCATYAVGLSGSAWYLTTLYSYQDWPNGSTSAVADEIKQNIQQHPDKLLVNIPRYMEEVQKKEKLGDTWSFTDIFGHMIGDTLVKDRAEKRWSEQRNRISKGEAPLPLLACLHAYDNVSAEEFSEWIEISPFEVFFPKYGASVEMKKFGSKYFLGKIYDEREEPPMHFKQGICGSAYSILYQNLDSNEANVADKGKNPFGNIVGKITDSIGENILNTRELRSARIPNMMKQCSFEPCFTHIDNGLCDDISRMCEPLPAVSDLLCVVDAGLSFNSPYPLILNPHRNIDLIISFDFSNRGGDKKQPFQELFDAQKWAKQRQLKFPPINTEKYQALGEILEVYVFEDEEDKECPIIMHFVLVNKDFKTFLKPGERRETEEDIEFGNFPILDDPNDTYSTFKFQYDAKSFDRLSKLMEFNVLNNIQKIKECILKAVNRKQGILTD